MGLPSESVIRPIAPDHGGGSDARDVVAFEAGRVGGDWPREVERPAGRRVALTHQLLRLAVVAKVVDDIRLPIDGSVAWIRGVERRLLVGVILVGPTQITETFR